MEKLAGTSVATTAFCDVQIKGLGWSLYLDGNGKITAGNGTLAEPRANAFSLVQVKDCPGATETCKASCYVHGLEKGAPDTHKRYQHNSTMIRGILMDPDMSLAAADTFGEYIAKNCRGGFRWHVSGDVFSLAYALWIVAVCRRTPGVPHWIYTRSFQYLPDLLPMATVRGGNLAINLSADKDNYAAAAELARAHGLRICYLTDDGNVPPDLDNGDVIFPDYVLRGGTPEGQTWFNSLGMAGYRRLVCPVDYHGKSEVRRCGPCDRCMT